MIDIEFEADKENCVLSLSVKGHSNYAEKGSDIVCAASSMLAYTLADCVDRAHMDGKLREYPVIKMVSGNALIIAKTFITDLESVEGIFSTIQNGYRILASKYPGFVYLNEATLE